MSIAINSIYEIIALVLGLVGFIYLAFKRFELAIYLIIILLPLYLLKVKLFFAPFNVLEILIWLLFFVWLMNKSWKDIRISEIKNFTLPSLIILIGTILATLFSDNLSISAGILKGWFVAPLVFGLVLVSEFKGEEQIKKALWALFISASLVAIIALVYWLDGKLTFDGRLKAFFLSPNHLAMYLAPGFLIGLWRQSLADDRKQRTLVWAGLAAIGLALYFTFSYLAWISILVVVVFLLFINFAWEERNKKFLILKSLFLILLVAILLFSQWGGEKLSNFLYSSRSSWQSRLMIWQAAWQIAKEHPIFGIGPGMFQEYYLRYQSRFALPYLEWAVPQPHNLFLAFWLQTGIFGLIGLIWLLIVFFKKIFAPFKNRNQLALILFMLMGYVFLHGLADTTYFKNDLAVIFWLIVSLSIAIANERSRVYN